MTLKNEFEPRMNTDETQMNTRRLGNCAHTEQVNLNYCLARGFIRDNPCSSVAQKGFR